MKVKKCNQNKVNQIIMYLFVIGLLAINAIRIFSDSIWGDEGFSIRLGNADISYIIDRTARDVHPPLYYLILKLFFVLFGTHAEIGKAVSFFPILIVSVLAITYFYKQYNAYVAMIIVGFTTWTTNCIEMIVEIRMYTWSLCFVFCNAICINELLKQDGKHAKENWLWCGLTFFSLCAAYTHYYALITVTFMDAAIFIWLILHNRKSWVKCILSGMTMVLGYLPWLFVLLRQFARTSQEYWIPDINLKSYLLYIFGYPLFSYCFWGILIITLIFFVIGIKRKTIESNQRELVLICICLIATLGTIAVGVILSKIFRPLYIDRYIFQAIGLVAIVYAIVFTKVWKKNWLIYLFLTVIFITGFWNFNNIYREENGYKTEETKQYMTENMLDNDVILTDIDMLDWTVLDYYFPDQKHYLIRQIDISKIAQEERIWLMLEKEENMPDVSLYGYTLEKKIELGLDKYTFVLYLMQ